MKLNLGAGGDIRSGYVNHDRVALPGIDVVHDLEEYPWPWPDTSVDEVVVKDVLEHLDDFVRAMEELYRILKPGGTSRVKVPYWNSSSYPADPTHRRGFHELTFRFFDPESACCRERPYYSHARFRIVAEAFVLHPLNPYFSIPGMRELRVTHPLAKRIVGCIGNMISNVILDLDLVLQKPTSHGPPAV